MTIYNYYYDTSHGWLEVTRQELQRLNIANRISAFSYIKGDKVYLEEDADANIFIEAKKEASEDYKFEEIDHGNCSKIREYESVQT